MDYIKLIRLKYWPSPKRRRDVEYYGKHVVRSLRESREGLSAQFF